jgi:hypothetical protein
MGTVAGDDTIIVVIREDVRARDVAANLRTMAPLSSGPRRPLLFGRPRHRSVAARTLRDEGDLDVVAALVDLGQPIDRAESEARAAAGGAELRIVDARDEFAESFCSPRCTRTPYEGKYRWCRPWPAR